jgi:hypothetical protein
MTTAKASESAAESTGMAAEAAESAKSAGTAAKASEIGTMAESRAEGTAVIVVHARAEEGIIGHAPAIVPAAAAIGTAGSENDPKNKQNEEQHGTTSLLCSAAVHRMQDEKKTCPMTLHVTSLAISFVPDAVEHRLTAANPHLRAATPLLREYSTTGLEACQGGE